MKHDFKKQVRSFGYAWNGLKTCIGQEQHLDFHLLAAVAVTVCGWLLGISRMEWIAVTLCIGMVIAAELFNTAVETLTDLVSPEWNALAGKTKEVGELARVMARKYGDQSFKPGERAVRRIFCHVAWSAVAGITVHHIV